MKKKLIKIIKILKKMTGSVRFRFYKSKIEKLNRTRIEKNQAKPKNPVFILKTKPKPVGLNQF
jgi:hypothetical protein